MWRAGYNDPKCFISLRIKPYVQQTLSLKQNVEFISLSAEQRNQIIFN